MKTLVIGNTQYEIHAIGAMIDVFKVFTSSSGKQLIRVDDPAIKEIAQHVLRLAA